MKTKFKALPNYETYKERIVYSILLASCGISSIPLLVPESYFIKHAHDEGDDKEEDH